MPEIPSKPAGSVSERLKSNPNLMACPGCQGILSRKAEQCQKCGWLAKPVTAAQEIPTPARTGGASSSGQIDLGALDFESLGVPTATYSPSPSFSPIQEQITRARSDRASESKRSQGDGNLFQWIFAPWTSENRNHKYGNLDKAMSVYTSVAKIGFVLWSILACLTFLGGMFYCFTKLLSTDTPFDAKIIAFLGVFTVTILQTSLIFLIAHLAYIFTMAAIDFLRCLIDIEANTNAGKRR